MNRSRSRREAGRTPDATVPLPAAWSRTIGTVRVPRPTRRLYVVANFAASLDGVVALGRPGESSGGEITAFDPEDRLRMAVLRAVADVVVIGAGTLRAVPRHTWNAEHLWPEHRDRFRSLRRRLHLAPNPWVAVVTASGKLDPEGPMLRSGEVPVLVVTTRVGAARLRRLKDRPGVVVRAVRRSGRIPAADILGAIATVVPQGRVLLEGGPHLFGTFVAGRKVDELFLTLSPQLAGRDTTPRPGLIAGVELAPLDPRWTRLSELRVGRRMLFLRYRFLPAEDVPRQPGRRGRAGSRGEA